MYFSVQTLSWVSSKIGYKLGPWIEAIITSLLRICEELNREVSDDTMNQIVEESLNSIECLVQRCPKEITNQIKPILNQVEDFMTYDPNYNYDNEEDMEVDEGWGEEDDEWGNQDADMNLDDDSSWKVRRASIRVILAVIHSRPERLRELYQNMSTKLVQRFKERDDKIQAIVLNTFAALLRSSFLASDDGEESKDFSEVGLLRT